MVVIGNMRSVAVLECAECVAGTDKGECAATKMYKFYEENGVV
jgi:hypothetical protein